MQENSNLNKLKRLMSVFDEDNFTKADFENELKKVIELVVKMYSKQEAAISKLEETYRNVFSKLDNDSKSSISDLKKQVDELFVGERISKIDNDFRKKIKEIDDKMSKIRNGLDGKPGPKGDRGQEGLQGKMGLLDNNQLESLKKELKDYADSKISNIPRGSMGMRKVPIVRSVNLTSFVDGVTSTFTLPKDTIKVLGVWSTQFPVTFDADNDFSFNGRTLTINGDVIQSGQTLWVLIETMFYAK